MEKEKIQKYYDEHAHRRLLVDYIFGNPRMERAMDMVSRSIPSQGVKNILDIGCGIGYSSHMLKSIFKSASVTGVDISQSAINIAQQLFSGNDICFLSKKAEELSCLNCKFDLITMIDVYEHIPDDSRGAVPEILKSILADNGWLVMTTPTVEAQEYLRKFSPDKLQVVDENITEEELFDLVRILNATLCCYQKVSVFRPWDYQYFICRQGELDLEDDNMGLYHLPPVRFLDFIKRRLFDKIERTLHHKQKSRHKHVISVLGIDPVKH